jgi:two-component system response regulator VicR
MKVEKLFGNGKQDNSKSVNVKKTPDEMTESHLAPPHLLYVEDDQSLGFVTRDNLELHGYRITHCADGHAAIEAIANQTFDLCILDVMLPGIDGFTIAERIREKDRHTPIIFLTAKSLQEDRIHGLRIGADDYLTKPFSLEELILKIEVFLRRSKTDNQNVSDVFVLGAYQFDYPNLSLMHQGSSRQLTQREADLLRYFARRPNEILKRPDILRAIWGDDDYFLGRSLDVFISRLRKYLQDDPDILLENIHSVGFRLVVP